MISWALNSWANSTWVDSAWVVEGNTWANGAWAGVTWAEGAWAGSVIIPGLPTTYIYRATDVDILDRITQIRGAVRSLTINDIDGEIAVTPAGSMTFQYRVWQLNDIPDNTDIEVLIRIKNEYDNTSTFDAGPALRINSTGQYAFGTAYLRTMPHRFVSSTGVGTTLTSTSALEDIVGVYSWLRYRVESGAIPSLRLKAWPGELEDEPSDWRLQTFDPSNLNADSGGAGWISQDTELWRWTHLSVGLGGESAPDPRQPIINAMMSLQSNQTLYPYSTSILQTLMVLDKGVGLTVQVLNVINTILEVFSNHSINTSNPYYAWANGAWATGAWANGTWVGSVRASQIYNELISLLASTSISNVPGVSDSDTVINVLISISHAIQESYQGYELGTALLALSNNISLDTDTQAIIHAVIVLLNNNIISVGQFQNVINVILSLDKNYSISTSTYETPASWPVKAFKIKIGE